MKYVDIVLVKSQVADGKLTTKVDALGNIYLEDTFAGEAVKIGKLPECYSFHTSGKWEPIRVLHDNAEYSEEWFCSNCRRIEKQRYDWCTCGADMRESNKPSKEFKELVDTL